MSRFALVAWSIVAFGAVTAAALVLLHRQIVGDPSPVRYHGPEDGIAPMDPRLELQLQEIYRRFV